MVRKRLSKGMVHVYTGNGKGKTTVRPMKGKLVWRTYNTDEFIFEDY